MGYTRDQIRTNRMKWINFLMTKGRKKAREQLDAGDGKRCCLGHGCFILGIKKTEANGVEGYAYDGEETLPPPNFVLMVGLYNKEGTPENGRIKIGKFDYSSLAEANDEIEKTVVEDDDDNFGEDVKINVTPLQIGKYLLSVIEGGEGTPFCPLTNFPENI